MRARSLQYCATLRATQSNNLWRPSMYETLADIEALFGEAEETVILDFKSGLAFNDMNAARSDLVKEVTGFANAGGGTIIYGIAEIRQDGRSIASALSPVTNPAITQDRLTEIVYSNTDPALRGFSIKAIDILEPAGRIFVITVEQGDTAYQNRLDQRYYARVDASCKPMYGFAIRDVMNRRTYPRVVAKLIVRNIEATQTRHRYTVTPVLANEGLLTANHWTLQVIVPTALNHLDLDVNHLTLDLAEHGTGHIVERTFEYSSERQPPTTRSRLLPGETRSLGQGEGFGMLRLNIESALQLQQLDFRPSLSWSLFVDNAPRQEGIIEYDDRCRWQ